ncbi:MAG: hypothetical protein C0200_05180 [Thermoproteota archaeon]|nr:MAG: hypothetical protein C0200_05180 [Candidatus Korarchaeota archaeon]
MCGLFYSKVKNIPFDGLNVSVGDLLRRASEALGPGIHDVLKFHLRKHLGEDPFIVVEKNPRKFLEALMSTTGSENAVVYLKLLYIQLAKRGVYASETEFINAFKERRPDKLKKALGLA